LASHLKPLEKDDRLTDMKFTQPWNVHASKKEDTANKPDHADIPKVKTTVLSCNLLQKPFFSHL
jgi:hypothetical protein